MDLQVPDEDAWGEWRADLDTKSAHESFAGKTAAEAAALFRDNVLWHTGELEAMPPVPFRYYMLALKDYILSPAALEDECDAADGANCFLGLIETKLHGARTDIEPIMASLLPAVAYVSDHQETYSATVEICGDFRARGARIRELVQEPGSGPLG
jgi:hypothetical protein